MKPVYFAFLGFLVLSCSHHHKGQEHHHHDKKVSCEKCKTGSSEKYGKKCAHSVMEGNLHVAGSDEFKLDHGGQTYYFSSKEKMEKFKEDLGPNVSKANTKWENGW